MKWVNKYPTRPGYWWFRMKLGVNNYERARVVRVERHPQFACLMAPVLYGGGLASLQDLTYWGWVTEWSSRPIKEPE